MTPLPRFRLQIASDPNAIDASAWNALLARQHTPTPFMRMEYLAALDASGSAVPATGWAPRFFLLWDGATLAAACPLYVKGDSWGEYVFDWSWARAYADHGLAYYPKAVVAVPFTPVPGSRLLACNAAARSALVSALKSWCARQKLSSLHVLFCDADDRAACANQGLLEREQVEFHWHNRNPESRRPFLDFDDFLAALSADKRKKIRQERRRVHAAGVSFRCSVGKAISRADWYFFYHCYERTYLEHGNAPYLTPAFFDAMAGCMADSWVLFIAERRGRPIAASLIGVHPPIDSALPGAPAVAYGRYWGAVERVDCLHFEACYYRPMAWCIAHGISRFEGGAQGEHKLARGLLPAITTSTHWLAHPAFATAVERFLEHETPAVESYGTALAEHSPFRHAAGAAARKRQG